MSTMEANEDKIDGALQGGQRLVDSNNLYSGKVQDKMDSIKDRSDSGEGWKNWLLNYCMSDQNYSQEMRINCNHLINHEHE